MRRFLPLFIAFVTFVTTSWAQSVTFRVDAPKAVAMGASFRVEFVVNAVPERGSFKEPTFEGLSVSAGPATSQSSSYSIINGKTEQSVSYSYGYVLYAASEGEYTIGEAAVKVDGKVYKTSPQTVKVVKEQATSNVGAGDSSDLPTLAEDDILLLVSVDRSRLYVGQPVVVSYKLLTKGVAMSVQSNKMPTFSGFWANRLNTGSARWITEEYNGKIYESCVVAEYLLFPQQEGEIKIDPMELDVVAQLQMKRTSRHRDPFEEFFSAPRVHEVHRKIISETPTLKVKALPADAPESFAGAVGEFDMEVSPLEGEVEANSAFTLTVKIEGEGNFSMIQTPHLNLPATFEQYPAKSVESIQTTARGVAGYRQFEYPIIARAEGDYVLPAVEFTYFNPTLAKYVTLTSSEHHMRVAPDSSSTGGGGAIYQAGTVKNDVLVLGDDIRYIELEDPNLSKKGRVFMWSETYFLIVALMLIASALLYVWLSRYLKQLRNQATLKGKRANKVALARFRQAERHMKSGNERGFYEEMLRGLWGYLSDKLNIPSADLTKENIRERLASRGASAEDVEQYVGLITECEYAQYSPSSSGHMEERYLKGVTLISRLEGVVGK